MAAIPHISSPGRAQAATGSISFATALTASIAGPALLSLAFPPFNVGVVGLVAFVPLFILWSKLSWKRALWWGWLSGTLVFLCILYWTGVTVFEFAGIGSVLVLILLCSIEGLAIAATAVTAALVGRGAFQLWSIFALPCAWLLFESIRTRGSLGVPFGEVGLVASHLPWLLPLAAYGGVYLLTAVVVLANAAVAGMVSGPKSLRVAGAIVTVVLIFLTATAFAERSQALASPTLTVAVAQGNIDQAGKWKPEVFARSQAIYTDLTRQAASRGAKVVVWPETAITTSAPQDPSVLKTLSALAASAHIWMLAGTIDSPTPEGYYNALLDVAPDGSVSGVYHKRLLVPFAEYVPFDRFLRRLPVLDEASSYLRGPGPHLLSAGGYQWGTLICFESTFAPYARATANAGADVLVIATDDAWFSGTTEPYQHADAAIVQAVATGRWIVRAASTGISEIIDPHGDVISELGVGQQGIIVANVGRGIVTPYDRYGIGWLILLSIIVVVGSLVLASHYKPDAW